jgi:hypothetical protein
MRAPFTTLLAFALIAAVAGGAADAAKKKTRPASAEAAVSTDSSGTPVIMRGLPDNYSIMKEEPGTRSRTAPKSAEPGTRPLRRTIGSSTYVPPPVPSPMAGGPSPQELLRGVPQINAQPSVNNSFSDRVTRCNHSFPLNAGIGNNPNDRSAYVRQCAN